MDRERASIHRLRVFHKKLYHTSFHLATESVPVGRDDLTRLPGMFT
jgi:hypothetical protein